MIKTLEEQLEPYVMALCESGTPMDAGCSEDNVPHALSRCRERSDKPYCVVSHWQWWDIDLSAAELAFITKEGLQPALLYAHIVHDERNRFPQSFFVRTTLLKAFHDNCVFESCNTLYILQGSGVRKCVDKKIALSIF